MKKSPPTHGGDVYAAARDLAARPEELLDFSASINPLGFPPGVPQAVLEAMDAVKHYPDPGCRDLREDLARFHGLSLENVLVGNGSTELIYLTVRALEPARALVAVPAFSEYERALELAGVPISFTPTAEADNFTLKAAPETSGCDMFFLANPLNPGGGLLMPDELAPIIEALDGRGVSVVLDEAFVDFVEEASMKTWLDRFGRLVILRSFTKFFAIPGMRLGYALADEKMIRRLEAAREPWSVNAVAQAAGRVCLKDAEFMARTRETVARERERLQAGLAGVEGLEVFPGQANYLLVKIVRPGPVAADLRERMLAHKVLIRDASNFRGLDERFFRVAVRLGRENDRLLEAVRACLNGE